MPAIDLHRCTNDISDFIANGGPAMTGQKAIRPQKTPLRQRLWRDRYLYLLLLPVLVYYVLFKYVPFYGIQMAFKDFDSNMTAGVLASEWKGFYYFKRLFSSIVFFRVFKNTIILNIMRLAFGFPAPIFLALMLNEVHSMAYKRISQSIMYIPHFFSWVVLGGIVSSVLSPSTGIVNVLYKAVSGSEEGIYFLMDEKLWRPVYVAVNIWKEVGWGTIIFLAAISGVDVELYEAAIIDGANKAQQIWHITLPGIRPTIVILLILRMGAMMDVGMESVLVLENPVVRSVSDVFSTYIYRQGVGSAQYSLTTAMGLFQSVISCMLLLTTNAVSNRLTGDGIW